MRARGVDDCPPPRDGVVQLPHSGNRRISQREIIRAEIIRDDVVHLGERCVKHAHEKPQRLRDGYQADEIQGAPE